VTSTSINLVEAGPQAWVRSTDGSTIRRRRVCDWRPPTRWVSSTPTPMSATSV